MSLTTTITTTTSATTNLGFNKDPKIVIKDLLENGVTAEKIILIMRELGENVEIKEDEEDNKKNKKNKNRFPKGKAINFQRQTIMNLNNGVEFMSVQDISRSYWHWTKANPMSLPYYRENIRIFVEILKEHLKTGSMDKKTRQILKDFYNFWEKKVFINKGN
jgi:hypothetical protein